MSHPAFGGKTVCTVAVKSTEADAEMADINEADVEDAFVPPVKIEHERIEEPLRDGSSLAPAANDGQLIKPIPHPSTGGKTTRNMTPPDAESDFGPCTQDSNIDEVKDEVEEKVRGCAPRGIRWILKVVFLRLTSRQTSRAKSEWDDSEDESEEDDALDAPSTDIRGDFERVLDGPLDSFKGSYYFHKNYAEFPNPLLRLDSLGHIGLPLSTREAKHVIAQCIQAPFGQGERTLVDKNVRDAWEMDASQIHFDNPAWKTFIHQVSQEVCLKLGLAAGQASTVRCEPYKLLLYETGSHFLPHQDTEKAKGMFATIVVVLPSPFQGGAAHLSHGDLSTTIDSSSRSLSNVSVLAWYTDVIHEIKPITGGYRLAIAFNLIQTANSRPKLPETSDFLTKMRHVLLSWKHQPDSAVPAKLLYLLQHKYSLASLRGNCLKGADAYKVGLLQSLAKQLNFDIGLANVECHLRGYGDDYGGYRGGYGSSEGDDDDVGMAEVEERSMSIGNLVDLDGRQIQDDVECEEDDSEFCPENLRENVEGGDPDEREYEGYQGNGAGSLELWYRRTVLVLWPHRRNAEMAYGDHPDRALAVLASQDEPDGECRLLARFLLRGIASQRFGDSTVQGLCKTAVQWKDLSLWLKTLDACDPNKVLNILTARPIVDAIEAFGFETRLEDALAKILEESPSNLARIKLLDSIMAGAAMEQVDNNWLARQRYRVMKTLKKPSHGEEELLVKLTVEGGGVPFLQNTILPQVISTANSTFLLAFSIRLTMEQSLLQTEEYVSTIKHIVRDLLQLAIEKTDFFSAPLSSAQAYSFIKACVQGGHPDLAELVIDQLVVSSVSSDTVLIRTCDVLIPLIPQLRASDRPIPGLSKLCRVAVENYTKHARGRAPADAELAAILDAILGTEDTTMLPKLVDQFSLLPPNEALCRSLVKNLRSREQSFVFSPEESVSISTICTAAVQNLVQRTQYNSNLPVIVSHFQLCLSTDNIPILAQLFPRLLSPAVVNQRYIIEVLLPFVPKVQAELATRNISPASQPFGAVFKHILELYASKVLGQKASDHSSLLANVKKWPSCCSDCTTVVKFFLQSQDRQIKLYRIGKPQRTHVEQKLSQFCGYRIANWSTIKSSPQGLEVNKSELLYSSIVWTARQAKLKEVLGIVSKDGSVLREIFGDDYRRFRKSMGETVELEAGPPPAKKRRVSNSTENLCSLLPTPSYSDLVVSVKCLSTLPRGRLESPQMTMKLMLDAPEESQGTRFVLASTDHLHTKIGEMGQRIRQLEDALAIFQASTGSNDTHPLLRDELLSIKFGPEKGAAPEKQFKAKEPSVDSIDALGTLTIGDDGDGKFGKYFGPSAGSETLFLAGAEMEMPGSNDFPEFPLSVEIARLSNSFPFSAGVLFMFFALGALVDLTLEPHNAESDRYYHASRAAMALRSVFDSPEMATVQAVLLMASYHNMGGRTYTMESSWSLMCLGSKLAQSLGLHRDSARWNMDPKTVNRRRSLFWELFSAELFQSIALGRPPSIRLSYVDCEFPAPEDQTLDENGNPRISYYEWKYTFTRDVFSIITERTLTAESPTYETVLELDRLVRAKTLPPYLNVFLGREDENCTPSVYMRGCLLGQFRSVALLYIHRTFFAQAMLDHPVNPLRSPYAPSFLAAYRCASGMIKANLNHFERFPELCCRWWVVWTHLFSAAIIVGCIVTRSPSSSMAPTAFIELGLACDLFEKGAKFSRRARSGLAILCKLREKAFQVYSQFRSGNPAPPPTGFGPGLFDYGEDELALFGGQTRVMVSKLIKGKEKGREKDRSSKDSHLPSSMSSPSTASTPSSSMSDPVPDVHPSLVEYLSLFPPSQHPSPSSQDSQQSADVPYQPEMMPPVGQSASLPSTAPYSGYDQTFVDEIALQVPQYYVDPDTPPKDISDLGMLMSGDSGIDEQWRAFMKTSFTGIGIFDENMPPVPSDY
ncbi:Zn(2)-C6 fungal-type domain-containing protein [Mycena venus]|uniref:Zn(2)-C6 fungal-type domain-containing protein n=1 Tax=Mycena venus TaxID=2733690 RepID=A0A8H6Y5Q5_9AGAR|nr:Zn(2)-C6 fungal-type domain-containing protein [Mycena venus]